jgi:uncharacterized membrane protein
MTKRRYVILSVIKLLILFCLGGLTYVGLECLWRGYSHISMFIVGGICFLIIGGLNNIFGWDMPFWLQCTVGGLSVTGIEFISGIILNIILKLNVWDYSDVPFNILGQICLPATIAWIFLSAIAIFYDDYVRYWFFGEEKPRYNWGLK